jgi:hypothetical protein
MIFWGYDSRIRKFFVLISVHIPKTAGTSFLTAIESYYGERLLRDYSDMPINRGGVDRNLHAVRLCLSNTLFSPLDNNTACIHGHFLPMKYRYLRTKSQKRFIVWMRDPVERIFSHYYYWVRNYNPADAGNLHRRVVEEEWSLERFCLSNEMRNIYSKFFWCFPIRHFGFIGITEYYDTEIEYLSREILNIPIDELKVNTNPHKIGADHRGVESFRARVESFHRADIQLYQQALRIRKKRL